MTSVRREDVEELGRRLAADGLSASTIKNAVDPLRVIFRRALRANVVAVDPTKDAELHGAKAVPRDRTVSVEEAALLLDALPLPLPERALYATALYAGLPRGELRALRWSDVDLRRAGFTCGAGGMTGRASRRRSRRRRSGKCSWMRS